MPVRLAVTLLLLAATPALALEPAEKACVLSMAERLPKLPGLRVLRTELDPWPVLSPRAAPAGMRRQSVRGRLVVEAVGIEAAYAFDCSLLLDGAGRVHVEPEQSSIGLAG